MPPMTEGVPAGSPVSGASGLPYQLPLIFSFAWKLSLLAAYKHLMQIQKSRLFKEPHFLNRRDM